jgi:hypothetical protein
MRALFAVLFAVTFLAPQNTAAQSGSAVAPVGDTIAATAAAVVKKKKGGMFGKFKGLAKNKVVKTVAKTALCTVVPGGQVVAGALDAAETKNVAGAAGAAGSALSGGGGGGCMPGMPGMAAPGGAAGGIGAAGVGALGAGASAAALPGQPSTGMPGMAMSPEQLKQMQEQYAKMGMDSTQLRAMQQMMAGLPGASPGAAAAPAGAAAATGGPALSREKGKMLVRRLPWVPGSDAVQQGSEPMFGMVMQEVAAAIKASPKRYKIEARVEEQGEKAQNKLLAQKRGTAVLAALSARGVPADALTVSEGKADKDPRIIISEGK